MTSKSRWSKTPNSFRSLANYPQFSQSLESREVLPKCNYSKIIFVLVRTRVCLIHFMYPDLTLSDFVLCLLSFRIATTLSSLIFKRLSATLFYKIQSCRILVIHFPCLHTFVVIPKIHSKIRHWELKCFNRTRIISQSNQESEKQADILPSHV